MTHDLIITLEHVSKQYFLYKKGIHRILETFHPRGRQYHTSFQAVEEVDFEVRRGESVAIIGRNGSGKSTLLQLICKILQPTDGNVIVNGRISALLELGAGFNPEFTGRENVYLNTFIMGLSKAETDARFDQIADFAEIGDFIDRPVKTYSSGMYVRLAFATAINVEPDILIVDEALAVG
ncbi:MAG: ABC transporter ATP-binding protein, partial [Candidatus Electrothrix sp. AR1]|nr:ABC transporter ATP-binding protein [Candidatus Electrothrix sp. AR1]